MAICTPQTRGFDHRVGRQLQQGRLPVKLLFRKTGGFCRDCNYFVTVWTAWNSGEFGSMTEPILFSVFARRFAEQSIASDGAIAYVIRQRELNDRKNGNG
jgi:hypothetical protein